MKILLIGKAEAGKTTAATMLAKIFATKTADISTYLIEEYSKHAGISQEEIRKNKPLYRETLWQFGRSKQEIDPAYFVKRALDDMVTVLTGVRNKDELAAVRTLFDRVIWIDRDGTSDNTCKLDESDADTVIRNNGSLEKLKDLVELIATTLVG